MACAGLLGACSTGPGLPGLAGWLRYLAWGSRSRPRVKKKERVFGFAEVVLTFCYDNVDEEHSSTIL